MSNILKDMHEYWKGKTMSDKPKIAWCHRANDNYYTDEQMSENAPTIHQSYIKFIEYSAYESLKSNMEATDKVYRMNREYVEQSKETIARLTKERDEMHALKDRLRERNAELEALLKDHEEDWKRIQDAERALEAEGAKSARLVEAAKKIKLVFSGDLPIINGLAILNEALAEYDSQSMNHESSNVSTDKRYKAGEDVTATSPTESSGDTAESLLRELLKAYEKVYRGPSDIRFRAEKLLASTIKSGDEK